MKALLSLIPVCLFSWSLQAQCPDVELGALQSLQKADIAIKESKIQDLGFDLHSEFVSKGATMRRYNKCWMGNAGGKAMYEQILIWNSTANHLTLLLFNEGKFQAFKLLIEERHNSASAQKNNDSYVGKMFVYRYSIQKIDNTDYFAVSINFKS